MFMPFQLPTIYSSPLCWSVAWSLSAWIECFWKLFHGNKILFSCFSVYYACLVFCDRLVLYLTTSRFHREHHTVFLSCVIFGFCYFRAIASLPSGAIYTLNFLLCITCVFTSVDIRSNKMKFIQFPCLLASHGFIRHLIKMCIKTHTVLTSLDQKQNS